MENYWHYLTDGGEGNLPPFSKSFSNPDKDFKASSTIIFGTEDSTVHLGYVTRKDNVLRWYDQQGNLIDNVNRWNYLPTDAPTDTFRKTVAKGFVSALDKMGY